MFCNCGAIPPGMPISAMKAAANHAFSLPRLSRLMLLAGVVLQCPKKHQPATSVGRKTPGRTPLRAFRVAHRLLSRLKSWWLGFRLDPDRASGPRAAARKRNFRVHGGTKAREASIARIGVARSANPRIRTQQRGLRIMKRVLSLAAAF